MSGRIKVGRAAGQRRQPRRDGIHHFARSNARCDAFGVGGKDRHIGVPVRAAIRRADFAAFLRPARGKACAYAAMRSFHAASSRAPRVSASPKVRQRRFGDQERRLERPAEILLGEAHLVDAERRPVRFEVVVLVGRAVADMGAYQHQRWPRRFSVRRLQRGIDRREIVAIGDR